MLSLSPTVKRLNKYIFFYTWTFLSRIFIQRIFERPIIQIFNKYNFRLTIFIHVTIIAVTIKQSNES